MPKTISISDIRKEAQKLIESGKMPPLHQLLGAVAYARQQYTPRIKAAQASGPEPEEGAPADFGGRVLQQTNPPTIPQDSEAGQPAEQPVGAHMSIQNAEPTDTRAFPAPEDVKR